MHKLKIKRFLKTVLVAPFLISVFFGCATTEDPESPAARLKQGRAEARAKNYQEAKITFLRLLEDSPDSKERIMALRYLADAHYTDEEYEDAKLRYQKFIELYPAHKYAAHAFYFKAMSDFKRIDLASRDQTYTNNAIEEFDLLLEQFPKSSYAKRAVPKKKECLRLLAMNLFEIGKYYYRTEAYQAAIGRFKTLLEDYPKQKFADEVLFLLGESYYREQNYKKGRSSFKKLLKHFPKSEYAADARERLREKREG